MEVANLHQHTCTYVLLYPPKHHVTPHMTSARAVITKNVLVEGSGEVDVEEVLMVNGQCHGTPGKLEVA